MTWFGSSLKCAQPLYWTGAVSLLIFQVLAAKGLPLNALVGQGLWMVLYRLRLRDCGRSQWWIAGMLLLSTAPTLIWGLVLGAHDGSSSLYAITHQGEDGSGHESQFHAMAVLCGFVVQLAFTVWLGLQKSRGETRAAEAPADREPTIWDAKLWEDEEPAAPVTAPAAPAPTASSYGVQLGARDRPVFGRRTSA